MSWQRNALAENVYLCVPVARKTYAITSSIFTSCDSPEVCPFFRIFLIYIFHSIFQDFLLEIDVAMLTKMFILGKFNYCHCFVSLNEPRSIFIRICYDNTVILYPFKLCHDLFQGLNL